MHHSSSSPTGASNELPVRFSLWHSCSRKCRPWLSRLRKANRVSSRRSPTSARRGLVQIPSVSRTCTLSIGIVNHASSGPSSRRSWGSHAILWRRLSLPPHADIGQQ